MFIEALLNLVFGAVEGLLNLLPDIQWTVEGSVFDSFLDVLEMVCYLLPMQTVVTMFGIVVGFTMFKVVISLIKTIWDILPLA